MIRCFLKFVAFILLLREKSMNHIFIYSSNHCSQQSGWCQMLANSISLVIYFELRFTPKQRTKRTLSGPSNYWRYHSRSLSQTDIAAIPAVMVSVSLALCASTLALFWISKRLRNPSLGFQSDCNMRGFSWSPTTRKHSVFHSWSNPVRPITSQSTYALESSFSKQYLWGQRTAQLNSLSGLTMSHGTMEATTDLRSQAFLALGLK